MKKIKPVIIQELGATHIWYNSKGQAANVTKETFISFQMVFNCEFLDKYGLVARSLHFLEKEENESNN